MVGRKVGILFCNREHGYSFEIPIKSVYKIKNECSHCRHCLYLSIPGVGLMRLFFTSECLIAMPSSAKQCTGKDAKFI